MSVHLRALRTSFASVATMALLGSAYLYIGCSSSSSSSNDAATPCDPLATSSTTLGTVLGVGEDSMSTIYVVDQEGAAPNVDERVFIVSGNALVRAHVLGSGASGALPNADFTFTIDDPTPGTSGTRNLLLQMRNGVATAMAFGSVDSKGFYAPDAGDVNLTLLEPSAVNMYNVKDDAQSIDYVADIADGTSIVVTEPANDDAASLTDYRLFYGPPNAMVERTITQRGADDFGTYISFTASGATYVADFAFTFPGPDGGGGPMPGTLMDGAGKSLVLTQRLPRPTTLSGFSFLCFAP